VESLLTLPKYLYLDSGTENCRYFTSRKHSACTSKESVLGQQAGGGETQKDWSLSQHPLGVKQQKKLGKETKENQRSCRDE
jgi:hypothetical protein